MGVEQREMSVGAYVLATYDKDSRGLDTVRVVSEEEFSEKGRDAKRFSKTACRLQGSTPSLRKISQRTSLCCCVRAVRELS